MEDDKAVTPGDWFLFLGAIAVVCFTVGFAVIWALGVLFGPVAYTAYCLSAHCL